jgi:hypothetical protein
MLTTEPIESVASRALHLENVLPPEVKFQTGSGLFARVLAEDIAGRTKGNQHQPKLENDSPGHVALLGFRTSEGDSPRKSQYIPLCENSFLGIGDIGR